jgi:membrane-bound metal-dependent hydrolase YbcI (DUF457 family)
VYAGHFAAGLAIKARVSEAPTWGLILGVGVLDVLFGPFVLLGIERVTLTPGISPGFALDYIDWSHSLLMSLIWSGLFALGFRRYGPRVAGAMALAVFSHFLLDIPMHPADLALWPGSGTHLGLGLWRTLPTGWWFVELGVVLLGGGYYWQRSRRDASFGGRAGAVVLVVLLLHLMNAPWFAVT